MPEDWKDVTLRQHIEAIRLESLFYNLDTTPRWPYTFDNWKINYAQEYPTSIRLLVGMFEDLMWQVGVLLQRANSRRARLADGLLHVWDNAEEDGQDWHTWWNILGAGNTSHTEEWTAALSRIHYVLMKKDP